MTNLQILLNFLDLPESVHEESILNNFDNQDAEFFTINGDNYIVTDYYGIKDLKRNQAKEEYLEFEKNNRNFSHILDYIDGADIINQMADDIDLDNFSDLEFLSEIDNMYLLREL